MHIPSVQVLQVVYHILSLFAIVQNNIINKSTSERGAEDRI